MRADSIASHGRTGQVTALSLGSFGRLVSRLAEISPILAGGIVEVWNLVSRVNTLLRMESKIDE
jgi:hypothetical protein